MPKSTFVSRFELLPSWFSPTIIVFAVVLVSIAFLHPSYVEFPMDDTYIHFVYAQNLSEQGKLYFSLTDEIGVGSTSLLWVLLLASGHKLGLSMHGLAKFLGLLSLATVGVGLYELVKPISRRLPALAGALLVVLSGNMIWFALSGMETMLFLGLGVLALLIYQKELWGWLGIVLGLLILTRPEGLALVVAIACIELWRNKGIQRGFVIASLIGLIICGPWFGYLLWRTGYILTTSAIGKQLTFSIGTRVVADISRSLAMLGRFPALVYVVLWPIYLLEFALGGIALPPPRIVVGNVVGNANYTISTWAFVGWIGVVLPLLIAAGRRVSDFRRWPLWISDRARRPMVIMLFWAVLHNLSYMVFMPTPGTASRYGAINHMILWLALGLGLLCLPYRRLRLWMTGGLIIIAAANILYWNGVYDANLDHMQNVRITAAQFIRDNFSPDERCAASDIGAIRYFSKRPIFDLGALVDPDAGQRFLDGSIDHYLVENGVTCVVLPGRRGTTAEGWFDMAEIMGLTTTPLFDMELITAFDIDFERWLQGYLPTNNYQASVTIYRLVAKSSSN
ncbi:MAG: hypothetical protein KAJ55_07680 [Anaerolineales bacterium]|nr:hypothetical protein [Anaerolineales bacterium]